MSEQFSSEQIGEIKEAFSYFDRDGDGCISVEEVGTVMRSLGHTPTQADLRDLTSKIKSPAGLVDFSDFLSIVANNLNNNDSEDEIKEAFKVFDKDGSGRIQAQELKHVLTTLGEKLTEQEADEMIKEADIHGTGFIHYEEFVKMLLAK